MSRLWGGHLAFAMPEMAEGAWYKNTELFAKI
jgi:hypothetical protein